MLKDEFPDDGNDWGYYHARAKIRNKEYTCRRFQKAEIEMLSDFGKDCPNCIRMKENKGEYKCPYEKADKQKPKRKI